MEIKNKLTVMRMEVRGDNGGKRERPSRNMSKGHIDKAKGEQDQGQEVEMAGMGGGGVGGENGDNYT